MPSRPTRLPAYEGIIGKYRSRLPLGEAVRAISLSEGNTPLIRLCNIEAELSGRVALYAKYEGLNPTGSFKDRGMTMAVTHAVAAGARAIICASHWQHLCCRRGLCSASWHQGLRVDTRRQDCRRKARPGNGARLGHFADQRQLRRWDAPGAVDGRRSRDRDRQLDQPLSSAWPENGCLSKSSRRWVGRPTTTACRLVMLATSAPIGSATASRRRLPTTTFQGRWVRNSDWSRTRASRSASIDR